MGVNVNSSCSYGYSQRKNTSLVSLQRVSYLTYFLYFTSFCNTISYTNHFIHCNKPVTLELNEERKQKIGFKHIPNYLHLL